MALDARNVEERAAQPEAFGTYGERAGRAGLGRDVRDQ